MAYSVASFDASTVTGSLRHTPVCIANTILDPIGSISYIRIGWRNDEPLELRYKSAAEMSCSAEIVNQVVILNSQELVKIVSVYKFLVSVGLPTYKSV